MPVRVRCPECANEIDAPERARGKAIKCPDCLSRVKVPTDGAPRKKKRTRPRPTGDDVLSNLDLRDAEDNRTKICPKCAKLIVDDELEECPACGVNIFTGQLSDRQRKKRANKGPDPEEFYGKVWKGSKTFVKKNRNLVTRTAINWTVYLTLAITCAFIAQWCYGREITAMMEHPDNQGVTFTETATVIQGDNDNKATFRGKSYRRPLNLPHPRVLAHYSPVVNFWRALSGIFGLGFGGWAIYLTTVVVQATMRGEKLNRIQPDFFGNITMGIRAYVWPWFVLMPIPLILAAVVGGMAATSGGTLSQGQQIFAGACVGGVYLLSLFLLPAATVHWGQNHTYPAWLLTRMLGAFSRTARASLTMSVSVLVLCGLLPIGLIVGVAIGWNQVSGLWDSTLKTVGGAIGLGAGNGFFDFAIIAVPLFMLILGIALFILFIILAFPTVYMMRAFGLYGLYFREELGIVGETTALQPCGFGPRYLAFAVDGFILGLVLGVLGVIQYWAAKFSPIYAIVVGIGQFVFTVFYFVSSEIGQARATPGKWSLGIMVLQSNNKPMDRATGIRRTLFGFVSALSLFGGFIMCLFTPDKSALHDRLSATKVCWGGDDNRS